MASRGQDGNKQPEKEGDFSTWMENLPPAMHDVPLNYVAIPGSHDSFAADLDMNSAIVGEDEMISNIVKLFGEAGRKVMLNWSVCQDSGFTQQLQAGVRYFDLRVAVKPGTEETYFVHGFLTKKTLEELLREIKDFLNSHPKEVVLLDMNHFYNMTEFLHKQTMSLILETFGDKMCPLLDTESVTLNMLWENNLQVLVFYHHNAVMTNMQFWPGETIPSPWPNTNKRDKLLQILENNYRQPRPSNKFYVTQGILTPQFQDVFCNLNGSLKSCIAEPVDPLIINWLKTKARGPKGLNICILDFIEFAEYIPTVIQLNHNS